MIAAWTVAGAENSAGVQPRWPTIAALPNPTFSFIHYTSPVVPTAIQLNGENLKAGKDYFATVDGRGEQRLLITFDRKFSGAKNAIAFKGSPNTTFPEIAKPVVSPAAGWEQESTKVTISADVHDPDDNLRTVTIDLSPFGGPAESPMAEQGKGHFVTTCETYKTISPGMKSLKIFAVDADKNTASRAVARFEVKEIPTEYGPGVLFDFKDGTAQGWTASNSKSGRVGGASFMLTAKFSLKVEPGQWGLPIRAATSSIFRTARP